MLNIKQAGFLLTAALIAAPSMAADRAKIGNPIVLNAGQCVAADEIYEPGEVIQGLAKGIAQVCANVKGSGVWLVIDKHSLEFIK